MPANCLSVFDHIVGLALNGIMQKMYVTDFVDKKLVKEIGASDKLKHEALKRIPGRVRCLNQMFSNNLQVLLYQIVFHSKIFCTLQTHN